MNQYQKKSICVECGKLFCVLTTRALKEHFTMTSMISQFVFITSAACNWVKYQFD